METKFIEVMQAESLVILRATHNLLQRGTVRRLLEFLIVLKLSKKLNITSQKDLEIWHILCY